MNVLRWLQTAAAIAFIASNTDIRAAAPAPPGNEFRRDLLELLSSLSNARLLPELNADQEAEFLLNFLQRLSIPAIITNLQTATSPQQNAACPLLQNLSPNPGILYVRLNNFQQPDADQNTSLEKDFKQQNGKALVVDLRHAQGFSTEAEIGNFQFLESLSVPILILMDSATAGTPESLIRKLRQEFDVLTLGNPSLGLGGAGQEIKLSSGLILRVPLLENNQLPGAIEPDVALRENPALFENTNTPIDPAMDPWCRHARDTLKLILTLN